MPNGTVKWFNPEKGFGFIKPEDNGKDVFVHISALKQANLNDLEDEQKVSYDIEEGRNGKASAINLQLVD
jgi:CspA family cold shock protein